MKVSKEKPPRQQPDEPLIALRTTLVVSVLLTAILEAGHIWVHADKGVSRDAVLLGAAAGFALIAAATAGVSLALLGIARLISVERACKWLRAPGRLLSTLWFVGDDGLSLAGRVFDIALSVVVLFAVSGWGAFTVLTRFHDPLRMSLLIAAICAPAAVPILLGLPCGLRFLRSRIPLSQSSARILVRGVAAGGMAGGLLGAGLLLFYKDEIFGAVDPYPALMAVLFIGLLFGLFSVAERLRPPRLARIPLSAVAAAGLLTGLGISAFSEGARGVVDQSGTLSGVSYRAAHRLLDMDADGVAWIIGGDCHPLDPEAGPFALEIPNNGYDEDCDGKDQGVAADFTDPLETLPAAPDSLRRPQGNVLLVISDATSAKHLKMYGYRRKTMPAVEAFAKKSVVFENAFSLANHTSVSMAALLTGRYPSVFPKIRTRGWNSFSLPDWTRPITTRLAGAGYHTRMTAGHRLGGFLRTFHHIFRGKERRFDAKEVGRQALEDLEAIGPRPEKPVFYVVHFIDPHHPYRAKEAPFRFGHGAENQYDAELAHVDRYAKPLLKLMQSRDYSDWLVIVTSDHGEAFREHDNRHHGNTLYNEEVKVPLIARVPGVTRKRVPTAVSHLDLVPTLMDWCGLDSDPELEGRSLLPLLAPRQPADDLGDRMVFFEFFRTGEVYGGSDGRISVILNKRQSRFEMYDIRRDPAQHHNIYRKGRYPNAERWVRRHVRESSRRLAEGDQARAVSPRYTPAP